MKLVELKKKLVKSSMAILLSAALVIPVAQRQFSIASAEGTDVSGATATVSPTKTPEPTATVEPAKTPNPTATVGPTKTPNPTATAGSAKTPKPTATARPARTPKPTIKPRKPKTPKINCKAGNSKLIVKYNTVKNAARLEIWYRCGKDSYYYQVVYGKAESNGTISVIKGKREINVYKKGRYTIKVRAYSEGKKYHSKWVKKTVTVRKAKPSPMDYSEG